jgi:4-hydroxy-4-methyl-2-oxoglutarate aldolase
MRMLSEAELAAWRAIPAAVVSDERAHEGVLAGVRPLFAGRPFAGQALTIEACDVDDGAPRRALASAWPYACIVVDAKSRPDRAVWGGKLIALARERAAVAVVVDGSVRDLVDLRASGLSVASGGVTPRGPAWGGRIGVRIRCGGVDIDAGDLIVGDDDGVIAVPLAAVTDELLQRCRARLAREAAAGTQ